MNDGLYLSGIWAAEVSPVLTFQVNDLTKPDTLSASYSLSFTLPDSLLIRDLLENAEQIDSGGKYPYETLNAQLYEEGELIFSGFARLVSFSAGWKITLFQATKNLFDALSEKSLQKLELSRFDHPWNLTSITALAGATVGAVYPVIDYGNLDGDTFAADAIFPAIYVHTLIRQMLLEEGYHVVGDWLQEELIKRLAIPFVEDEPDNHDPSWVEDRTARVTVGERNTPENPPIYFNKEIDFNPVPYLVDSSSDGYSWYDGKQNNYNTSLSAYVADTAMRLQVQAYQQFFCRISYGAMEASLQVLVNGNTVAQEYWSNSGPYNITGTHTESITLDEFVSLKKADQVTIRFTFNPRTTIHSSNQSFPIVPEAMWASFTPDATVRTGDYWPVARNLPDLTCAEILKTVALMTSSTFQVDELRKTVRLIPLDSVIARTAEAIDWSTRVEESEEPELSVILEPYGQKNNLKWKELDKVSPYGNGVVSSPARNLPSSTDLFELPFSACLNSEKSISAYGNPVQILTRTLTTSGDQTTLTKVSTSPRLILVEASKTIVLKANRLTEENTVRNENVTLTACWWADRSAGAQVTSNAFSLAFDKATPTQREQTLIQRYFSGLRRVLRRPRSLSVSMMLYPEDIAALDLTRPIRLKLVRAGALDISDCYFYLNKINSYTSATTCRIDIIPYY